MEPPLDEKSPPEDKGPEVDLERRVRRLTRRGFAIGGVAALAGFAGWRWLTTRGEEEGVPWPFRRWSSSTSGWRGGSSAPPASRPSSPAPRRGCLASTARSGSNRGSIGPAGDFGWPGPPASTHRGRSLSMRSRPSRGSR